MLLLSAVAVGGLPFVDTSLTVSAEKLIYGDFEYEVISEGKVRINKYNGSASDVVIPDAIDGNSVTNIHEFAFDDKYYHEISFPQSAHRSNGCCHPCLRRCRLCKKRQ